MFCAHLDTVPHDGPIEVELADGVYRSRGETILGADNKAAVTVLVELAARHAGAPPPVGLELVFTVAEEDGLRGAKELDLGAAALAVRVRARPRDPDRRGDHRRTDPPAADRRVRGRRGARRDPARGRAQRDRGGGRGDREMELGRLDAETTANVGLIDGGTAANVVAGRCRVEGEARSLDEARVAAAIDAMVDACAWAASEQRLRRRRRRRSRCSAATGCPRARLSVRLARAALERCGHRAARGGDRRRQRRQRADGGGLRVRCCSPTGPRPTTRPRRASPRGGIDRDARGLRGDRRAWRRAGRA